ncbi:DUF5812 family protein [Halobacteriales archaeon Cl-PHB]
MTDEHDGEAGRTKSGTFLVTHADAESAVLRDVADAEVHTLGDNPDLAVHEVVEATIAAEPPMEVTWAVETVESRREIPTETSPEPPTRQSQAMAADQPVGEVTTTERAGEGEVHVLTVPEADTDQAVTDVLEDEATVVRAAKLGVNRVEVRSADGVVSVRYLP